MIEIVEAIKTRWDAKGLSSIITGGVYHSRAPETAVMPYCIFSEISDILMSRSRISRYSRMLIQFDVYDVTPDLVGFYGGRIRIAFANATNDPNNRLAIPATVGRLTQCDVQNNPTTFQESDEVWRNTQTWGIIWDEVLPTY